MFEGKIGCEIECGYNYRNRDKIDELLSQIGWRLGLDGSVRITGESGEFKTKAYEISNLSSLYSDFENVSKYIDSVNDSCGLHIHVSFIKAGDYYKLCCWEFVEAFQQKIRELFTSIRELKRLTSYYCKFYNNKQHFVEQTESQLKSTYKNNRYYAVNFNAFNLYKTIEFRIFPGVKKMKDLKKYTDFLISYIDNFLNHKGDFMSDDEIRNDNPQNIDSESVELIENLAETESQEFAINSYIENNEDLDEIIMEEFL